MPIGPWEIVILLLILVIVFGAGRLSQVGGALGKTVREFRGAVQEEPGPAALAPTVTVTAPPVTCATCQATNPATNRFCSACGADMSAVEAPPVSAEATHPTTTNTCPSCATVNPAGQAFCGQCGTRLTVAA